MVAARVEQSRHDLADASQSRDDHLARLGLVRLARRGIGGGIGEARRDHAVVQDEKERRREHRERHRERDRLRGLLGNRAVQRAQAEDDEGEFAALGEEQDEQRPLAHRQAREVGDDP